MGHGHSQQRMQLHAMDLNHHLGNMQSEHKRLMQMRRKLDGQQRPRSQQQKDRFMQEWNRRARNFEDAYKQVSDHMQTLPRDQYGNPGMEAIKLDRHTDPMFGAVGEAGEAVEQKLGRPVHGISTIYDPQQQT